MMYGSVAYLVSQYPALSHAFIGREVASLREQGWDIPVFSVRRAQGVSAALGDENVGAAVTLLDTKVRVALFEHVRLLVTHPRAWFAGAWHALKVAGVLVSPNVILKRLAYFVEAVLLLSHLRRRHITHVHVHFANNAAEVARLCAIMSGRQGHLQHVSYSITMHSLAMHGLDNSPEADWPRRNERTWGELVNKLRSATFVVCISEFTRRELARLLRDVPDERLPIVHMGISPEHYYYAPPSTSSASEFSILFVGRLSQEKRPDLVVAAVAELRGRGMPVRAYIAGRGPMEAALRLQIAQGGVTEFVHLVGGVSQKKLPDLYHSADTFCLPSSVEGVPVVLMEAMSSGLPVVATDVAGIPELVLHRQTGMLVRPGEVQQLVAAITELMDDVDLRRSLAIAARRHVEVNFNSRREVLKLEALFRTHVASEPRGTLR